MYATLTKCPLFRGLDAEMIRGLIDGSMNYTLTDFSDGERMASRDTAYSGLMIILKGKVYGEMTDPSGVTRRVEQTGAPELIAPAFLFGGYNKLPIDIIADGPVRIMTLHRGYLFELMQENTLILSNFIDIISNRANLWSKKIFFLSFKSLQGKVAGYLLDNSTEDSPVLSMPDVTQIAAYFDATRTAVHTVLSEMEKKRVIRIRNKEIAILNRPALQSVVENA